MSSNTIMKAWVRVSKETVRISSRMVERRWIMIWLTNGVEVTLWIQICSAFPHRREQAYLFLYRRALLSFDLLEKLSELNILDEKCCHMWTHAESKWGCYEGCIWLEYVFWQTIYCFLGEIWKPNTAGVRSTCSRAYPTEYGRYNIEKGRSYNKWASTSRMYIVAKWGSTYSFTGVWNWPNTRSEAAQRVMW